MENVAHRAPSIGGVIKKMIAINPDLSAQQIIDIVKQSTAPQGSGGDFARCEVLDEAKALGLARATVLPRAAGPAAGV